MNVRQENCKLTIKTLEQQQKSGKWREKRLTDSMTGRDGIYRVCSECGYEEDYYSGRKLDYCPRCGVKMTESENKK